MFSFLREFWQSQKKYEFSRQKIIIRILVSFGIFGAKIQIFERLTYKPNQYYFWREN